MEMPTLRTKPIYCIFIFALLSIVACRDHHRGHAGHEYQGDMDHDHDHLDDEHQAFISDSLLEHIVLIQLKDSIDEASIASLTLDFWKLKSLNHVKKFRLGYPAATGDARLFQSYDISMSMYFYSLDELFEYQTDSTHLSLRNKNTKFMAGPPVVIDQWIIMPSKEGK